MFTERCLKCGTPFCKLCQLRASVAGLCTQCHHMFIVRDGVSAPVRNKKMQEVHAEETRKGRVFRVLSVLAPGAGHIYAQKPLVGLPLVVVWSAVLTSAVVTGPLAPLTTTAPAALKLGFMVIGGVVLLAVYVLANVGRPSFEAAISQPRRGAHRGYSSRASG